MSENVINLFKDPTTAPEAPSPVPVAAVAASGTERPSVPLWVRSARRVHTVATHDHTKTVCRAAARHGLYVVGGTRIVARRTWEGRTASRYERLLRAAEAAGNMDAAAEWEERGQRFRQERHRRRMDLLTAPMDAARGIAAGAAIGAGGLFLLGIMLAVANKDWTDIGTPTMALIELVRWVIFIITVTWGPLMTLGPWAVLFGLWAVGKHQQAAPQWALPANVRSSEGEPVTPSVVVLALRNLGIAPLRNAIKEMGDAGASMLGPIRSPDAASKSTSPCRPGCPRTRFRTGGASSPRTCPGMSTKCSSPSRKRPARSGCGSRTVAPWMSRSARPR